MSSLLNFQPSDALPPPRVTGMILPFSANQYGNQRDVQFAIPSLLSGLYDATVGTTGRAISGELGTPSINNPIFTGAVADMGANIAGSGLLGSAVKGAKPIGALGMGGGGVKPLTKEQIDPLGYGSTKGLLTRPLSEMNIGYTKDVDLIPQKNLNIEDLQGSVLFPLLGDQSATGLLINSIDDRVFKNPVKLEGGANFMRGASQKAEGSAWASGKGVISDINNRVKRVAERTGLPVKMIYTAMGKDAVDFATFPASVLAEQMPFTKIFKKDIKSFNDKMKASIKIGSDSHGSVKDFVGVESPNLRAYLETAPAKVRKKFVKLMDTAPFQNAGFPSVAQARYAVTDDALKNAVAGDTGLVIASPNLNKLPTDNPIVPHSTYPTQMYGDYVGGLNQSIPRNILFRDFFNAMATKKDKSGNLLKPSMKDYTFRLNLPTQKVDQELVDTIMNYSLLNR